MIDVRMTRYLIGGPILNVKAMPEFEGRQYHRKQRN
jgi:hypothetical protein